MFCYLTLLADYIVSGRVAELISCVNMIPNQACIAPLLIPATNHTKQPQEIGKPHNASSNMGTNTFTIGFSPKHCKAVAVFINRNILWF